MAERAVRVWKSTSVGKSEEQATHTVEGEPDSGSSPARTVPVPVRDRPIPAPSRGPGHPGVEDR